MADIQDLIPPLRRAAEQGNAEAQYRLGLLYADGEGVAVDYTEAERWLRAAAGQGQADAMRALSTLHANGLGVVQDTAEARRWLLAAAEAGDAAAQCAAAAMFQFGHLDCERDAAAMVHWYTEAARQDHARAQFALGKLCATGDQMPQDDEAAFQWLTLAILNGSEPAKRELAMLTARLDAATLEDFKQRMLSRIASH